MNDDSFSLIDKVIGAGIAAAFAGWAWVVNRVGAEHLRTLRDINGRIDRLDRTIDRNSERISTVEGRLGIKRQQTWSEGEE